MTAAQLEALAVYRTHKLCQCADCETARKLLKEMDERRDGCKPSNVNTAE